MCLKRWETGSTAWVSRPGKCGRIAGCPDTHLRLTRLVRPVSLVFVVGVVFSCHAQLHGWLSV